MTRQFLRTASLNIEVWRYNARSENHLSLALAEDEDFTFFYNHFVGQAMGEIWHSPRLEILCKKKKLLDFVSWDLAVPVISERAKISLSPLISPYAEMLPLIILRGIQYYAVNVTCVVDCVDLDRSETTKYEDGSIANIDWYAFQNNRLPNVPIFKVPECYRDVFVTRTFVEEIIQKNLRGAIFADPSVDPLTAIMRGESGNVVPGIPE
jgi:hypothetical protein